MDVTDFKSDEGTRVPWRVRFPSASAENDERLFVASDKGIVGFVHGVDEAGLVCGDEFWEDCAVALSATG